MLLTLLAVAAMTTSPDAPRSAAPSPTPADTGRVLDATFAGPAGTRAYKLYLPPAASRDGAAPLLVMLHGCTQTADDVMRGTRLNAHAATAGMLVVYPEQPAAANPQRCWNWYDPTHQRRDAGEPSIVAGLVRDVVARHGADPRRVYVAGISAGGAMALTLAAAYPELFAAAAVHSAVPLGAASDVPGALAAMRQGGAGNPEPVLALMGERRRLVPLLVVHGSADAVVSPKNAEAIAEQWRAAFGLEQRALDVVVYRGELVSPGPDRRPHRSTAFVSSSANTELRRSDTPPRPDQMRASLELRLVEGLGHAWSGGSADGTYTDPTGPDASDWIVRFLLGHVLPGSRQ